MFIISQTFNYARFNCDRPKNVTQSTFLPVPSLLFDSIDVYVRLFRD